MNDPYHKQFIHLKKGTGTVTINRSGAPDITGTLKQATEDGCTIKTLENGDLERNTFIAFRDIRGVSTLDWDMDAIAH